jgi:hypothetical protein
MEDQPKCPAGSTYRAAGCAGVVALLGVAGKGCASGVRAGGFAFSELKRAEGAMRGLH